MTLRAKVNRGGLSCDVFYDGVCWARVRLDTDVGTEDKRGLIKSITYAINTCRLWTADDIGGQCQVCGCTDEHPCPAGCAWVDDEETLCTECIS